MNSKALVWVNSELNLLGPSPLPPWFSWPCFLSSILSLTPSLEIGFKNLKIRLFYLFVFVLRSHKIPGRSQFSPATTWVPGHRHFYPMSHLTRSYLNIFVPIIQKKISVRSLFSSSFTTFFSVPLDIGHPVKTMITPIPSFALWLQWPQFFRFTPVPWTADAKLMAQSQGYC